MEMSLKSSEVLNFNYKGRKTTPAESRMLADMRESFALGMTDLCRRGMYVVQAQRNGYRVARRLIGKGLVVDRTSENEFGYLTISFPGSIEDAVHEVADAAENMPGNSVSFVATLNDAAALLLAGEPVFSFCQLANNRIAVYNLDCGIGSIDGSLEVDGPGVLLERAAALWAEVGHLYGGGR